MEEFEQRLFECKNYLIQKTDASGETKEEDQKIFDFLHYIENGNNKPF